MSVKSFYVNSNYQIKSFNKVINVDSDKSISIRSFLISSICEGVSIIKNALESDDVIATINSLKKLNVKIEKKRKSEYLVYGKGLNSYYCKKNTVLDFQNSGTLARLLMSICSTNSGIRIKMIGDKSLSKRNMSKIISVLKRFGAEFIPENKNYFPLRLVSSDIPIGIDFEAGISAQIKSGVILAGINSFGTTVITEKVKSRDHTERILESCSKNFSVERGKINKIKIIGKKSLSPIKLNVPGDPSSAAFFTALCLLNKNSKLIIKNIQLNQTRIGFYKIVKKFGGKIKFLNKKKMNGEVIGDIFVKSSTLKPLRVGKEFFTSCQDEYPIMFAMSAFLKGKSFFTGISDLRNKESDRIKEMEKILRQIGIKTKSSSDSLKIWGNINYSRKSIRVSSLLDHRILMSGLIISQLTGIKGKFKNFETVGTSSPNFLNILKKLGGKCEVKKKSN